MRVEKVFKIGLGYIGIYADITNVFNASQITEVQTRVPKRTVEDVDLT